MNISKIIIISLVALLTGCGLTSKDVTTEKGPASTTKINLLTDRGLSISETNGQKWQKNIQKGRKNGILSSVFNDLAINDGKVLLATEKGLAVSTDNMQVFLTFLADRNVADIATEGTDIYLATNKGCYLATKNYQFELIANTKTASEIVAQGRNIFIVDNDSIMSCTKNVYAWHTVIQAPEKIKDLYLLGKNMFYLTEKNLWLNGEKLEVAESKEFKALFVDLVKNIVWVSTDQGLFKSSDLGKSWVVYDKTSGLEELAINDIYVDNLNIYLATNNGLVHSINAGETWKTYKRQHGLLSNKILKLLIVQ